MISVREALDCVLRELPRLGSEQAALPHARGRILAETVDAPFNVPPFRNSAMDGYAVRSADLAGAAAGKAVRLRVLETVGAGSVPTQSVSPGTAVGIMTGAPVPAGADAVVRVEDTSSAGDLVDVSVAPAVGACIREAGEDMRAGERVFTAGRSLRPADIGLLASIGRAMVRVARRPRVAILATGDELVDIGQPLQPGQIVNSNAYMLAAAIEEAGGEPLLLGIIRDDVDALREAFADAFSADLVLSTGGVSVGNFDYVRPILRDLGYQERFWQVAQRPGKPLSFGCRGDTPAFGLPGNPVSALVCFYIYVLPALRTMMGMDRRFLLSAMATMGEHTRKAQGLTEFIRCTLEGPVESYVARSTGTQSSGVLRSLSLGDGLIVGPADAGALESGEKIRVVLLAPEAGSANSPV